MALWLLAGSWGYTGHDKIVRNSLNSFNEPMGNFAAWIDGVASHSGDPDRRKSWDDSEGIKHYIDLDNYDEYKEKGFISPEYDTLVARYGERFVKDQGTLPWATMASYDSLVSTLQRRDYEKALLFAADLSHYVADGHMPLHLTRNYNGQFTGNKGIHSRYESDMVNHFVDQLVPGGEEVLKAEDIQDFIFSYMYRNYSLLDSILSADDYAKTVSSDTKSTAYRNALWEYTNEMTIDLFASASHAFASLWYTAWLEAGSPDIIRSVSKALEKPFIFDIQSLILDKADSLLNVTYQVDQPGVVEFEILSLSGELHKTEKVQKQEEGLYYIQLNVHYLSKGVYLLTMTGDGKLSVEKFVIP